MKKLVLGLVFIFFNFNIPLNTSVINLIPSFLGYYFIIKACIRLADETSNLRYLETKKLHHYSLSFHYLSLFLTY